MNNSSKINRVIIKSLSQGQNKIPKCDKKAKTYIDIVIIFCASVFVNDYYALDS